MLYWHIWERGRVKQSGGRVKKVDRYIWDGFGRAIMYSWSYLIIWNGIFDESGLVEADVTVMDKSGANRRERCVCSRGWRGFSYNGCYLTCYKRDHLKGGTGILPPSTNLGELVTFGSPVAFWPRYERLVRGECEGEAFVVEDCCVKHNLLE